MMLRIPIAILLVIGLLGSSSGCSLMVMTVPNDSLSPKNEMCSTSVGPPVADIAGLLASLGLVLVGGVAGEIADDIEGKDTSTGDSALFLGGISGALFTASMVYGFTKVGECEEKRKRANTQEPVTSALPRPLGNATLYEVRGNGPEWSGEQNTE